MNNKWREFFNDEEPKYEYDPSLSLLSEDDFDDLEDYSDILNEAEELLDEKKGKKRKAAKKKRRKKKKKAKGKKDACYHKVRSRYDVWPSAYASGALVKCRKVGAKNWGNSTKEGMEPEEVLLNEFNYETDSMDLYGDLGVSPNASSSEIRKAYKNLIKQIRQIDPAGNNPEAVSLEQAFNYANSILGDEQKRKEYDQWLSSKSSGSSTFGSGSERYESEGLNLYSILGIKKSAKQWDVLSAYDSYLKQIKEIDPDFSTKEAQEMKKDIDYAKKVLSGRNSRYQYDKWFDSQSLVAEGTETFKQLLDEKRKKGKKKGRKLSSKPSSESSLRDWFKRKGAKGSKGGWVDCNAPDGKGGYKSCGRSSGEKRKRYPACRPTPGACKKMKGSKGKSWGKKDSKRRGKKK